jgi:small subunit ribosomal protein S21
LPKVDLRNNESQEQLLRRFRKEVMKSKVLADVRRKRWFVSKSEVKRIKEKKAARRQRRVQRRVP